MPQYIAIDLKSFYASVECVERGLDPLTTNLVVADESRTEKTICLAVSPSLKKYGIPGRARLFEVVQKVKQVNRSRKIGEPELSYIAAPPRMALYVEYSTRIYDIYLKYVAPEDIHVYSIDEVFMDVTHYLKTYGMTAYQLAQTIILDVQDHIGITATAGIGTNLYLCKIAMDIVAKHIDADENGVRIAQLDEKSYRKLLWDYRPITDFWLRLSVSSTSKSIPRWKTNKKSVATVDNEGRVTAVKNGTAIITVTVDGVSKTCEVTVKKPKITVGQEQISLTAGETCQPKVTVSSGNKPEYYSSNTNVATVNETGVITAIGRGRAYIYAKEDGTKVRMTVTVKEK